MYKNGFVCFSSCTCFWNAHSVSWEKSTNALYLRWEHFRLKWLKSENLITLKIFLLHVIKSKDWGFTLMASNSIYLKDGNYYFSYPKIEGA